MRRLKEAFADRKALIPYITAGDPSLDGTIRLIEVLQESGADIVEVGIPFSDPQADGPIIQMASKRAIERGTTLEGVLKALKESSSRIKVPVVLMGYYNPILQYGVGRFACEARESGVVGVIVPDLPFDEDTAFYGALEGQGVDGILMVAPNTPEERIKKMASSARGFVYCVSLFGITGDKRGPVGGVDSYLERVKRHIKLPLALGFGIDGPEKAKDAASLADGVVVGSALVKLIEESQEDAKVLEEKVRGFISGLREALDSVLFN